MPKIHEETQEAFGNKNKIIFVDDRIVHTHQTIPGYEVMIFYLPNSHMNEGEAGFIGSVTLFRPTQSALERKGGLDDLFQEMQEATRVGDVELNRRPARCTGEEHKYFTRRLQH